MTFKLMKEQPPPEPGLYQVFDTYRGWNLALWEDGMWHLIPNTGGYSLGYYQVKSWNYLHIPQDLNGKSASGPQDL